MKKLLLLFSVLIYAKTIEATYSAKHFLFGKIASFYAKLENNSTNYQIIAKFKTENLLSFVSKGLTHIYKSKGIIKNKLFIPLSYIHIIKRKDSKTILIYNFDHSKKIITKIKYKNSKLLYKTTLPYYTKYDILSLYWNSRYLKGRIFYAVGGRKKDGRIDIIKKKNIVKVNFYNEIFSNNNGKIILYVDKNWICVKGEIKNLLKLGKVIGSLTNLNVCN